MERPSSRKYIFTVCIVKLLVVTAENDEDLTPKIENVINLAQCWYEKQLWKI